MPAADAAMLMRHLLLVHAQTLQVVQTAAASLQQANDITKLLSPLPSFSPPSPLLPPFSPLSTSIPPPVHTTLTPLLCFREFERLEEELIPLSTAVTAADTAFWSREGEELEA